MRHWNPKSEGVETSPCDGCGSWLEIASFRLCLRCCRMRCGECLESGQCAICRQIEEAARPSAAPAVVETRHGAVDTRTGEVIRPKPAATHAQILHALHGHLNHARDYGIQISPPAETTGDDALADLGSALKGLLKVLPRARECAIPTQETFPPSAQAIRGYRAALERLIQAHDEDALSAPQQQPPSAQAAGL